MFRRGQGTRVFRHDDRRKRFCSFRNGRLLVRSDHLLCRQNGRSAFVFVRINASNHGPFRTIDRQRDAPAIEPLRNDRRRRNIRRALTKRNHSGTSFVDLYRLVHDDTHPAFLGDHLAVRQRKHDVIFFVRKFVHVVRRDQLFVPPKWNNKRRLRLSQRQCNGTCQNPKKRDCAQSHIHP